MNESYLIFSTIYSLWVTEIYMDIVYFWYADRYNENIIKLDIEDIDILLLKWSKYY